MDFWQWMVLILSVFLFFSLVVVVLMAKWIWGLVKAVMDAFG